MKLAALALVAACSSAPPSLAVPATKPFTPTAFSVKVTGAGRPVIFIPGLASPGAVWDGTVAHLGGKVQAHVLTLAGFDGQPPIQGPYLQQVHDQIVQYIAANHLEHPIVVGHSLGGVMSLWLAETDPAIGAIVDVDGFPWLPAAMNPNATADSAAKMAATMHQEMAGASKEQFDGFMHQFLGSTVTDPANAKLLDDAADRSDQTTVANAFAELVRLDLRAELDRITAPVIIAAAGESEMPKEQLAAAWKAQVDPIPHHQLVIIDGAKHFVMYDKPDELYKLVDDAVAQPRAK